MRIYRPSLRTIDSFASLRVAVIGDVMLDRTWLGPTRAQSLSSPALTPIAASTPVINIEQCIEAPGGAANVAANITALGAQCQLIGVIGDDDSGRQLQTLLTAHTVDARLVVDRRPTTTKLCIKTELRAGMRIPSATIARCDFESTMPVEGRAASALTAEIAQALVECDAVIISDYAKGVCTEAVCRHVLDRSALDLAGGAAPMPVVVDPKQADWSRFAGASAIVPNLRECSLASGDIIADDHDLIAARMRPFLDRYRLGALVVTRDASGLTILDSAGAQQIAATSTARDATGAGDTLTAVMALALARGCQVSDAAHLANIAAGCVVEHAGTAVVTKAALTARLTAESVQHNRRRNDHHDVRHGSPSSVIFGQG